MQMHDRLVVSNSTPIIVLSNINKLDILQKLYGVVHIPYAVMQEVSVKANHFMQDNPWLRMDYVKDKLAQDAFSVSLHSGEVEAILLTRQLEADLLILDDGLARKYAKRLNILITGTIGVILQAKNRGIISSVKPVLSNLIDSGFYLSEQVLGEILTIANESIQ
ncbi:MAG: DUF3368 domain-containing protein [Clostridium sp.]|jgi:predicted nucleic acid-binding protein|nr:DUF3368 domain-containing protein [Clostridium sp.]